MRTLFTRLLLPLAATAGLALCPGAAASEDAVVPPSNSAATQYTEAFPTSGGDKKTDQARHRSPSKVLGDKKAHKLEQQGPDGRAAAAAAAATAPAPVAPVEPVNATAPAPPDGNGHGGSGGNSNAKGGTGEPHKSASSGKAPPPTVDASGGHVKQPAGSSGFGAALGTATGLSSSGQTGLLLPLILLATILWSLGYLWQQRQRVG